MSSVPDRFAQMSPLKRALVAIDELQARLDAVERAAREPLAVIGIGCRIPGGANSPDALWRLLQDGVSAVREVPADRWDADALYDPNPDAPGKMSSKWGGFLEGIDRFDAPLFGIAPREAATMDPQQRVLIEVVWEALEHAGLAPERLAGSATGVFVGICSTDYMDMLKQRDLAEIDGHFASGVAHSIASGRLAYLLGLNGPAVSLDTACSSSLVAVHLACQSLRSGECRMAIAGGVNLILAPDNTIVFSKSRMMASDGRCKTFDASADGFVRGEGCGVVVLKRLTDARADGDRVLGVIRGSAINQDGASSSLTAPNGPAQEAVIRAALANSGVAAADVTYVEAHGTGTSLGDPIEVQALAGALGATRTAEHPLLIGSLKTNVGHLESAAGIAGLIKALLAVQHGEIPPHLHLTRLNPHVDWESMPIAVPTTRTAWPEGRPRIAGVSSFGFSGTNVHIIVEAAPQAAPSTAGVERPTHVLTVSARSEASLQRRLTDLRRVAATLGDEAVANVCHTAGVGRAHLPHRLAMVVGSADDLRAQLDAAIAGASRPGVVRGSGRLADRPRVAFLFTGQGAQHAGMSRVLYNTQPVYRQAFDRVADAMRPHLSADLRDVVFNDAASIDQTGWTQPALFAVEFALASLWQGWGVTPGAVIGHSIGELTAACVAGVLTLEDASRLVAVRGRLMQALPEGGAMAAIFADEARVNAVLAGFSGRLSIAAVNAPGSTVISGEAAALDAALARFSGEGVRAKKLVVSHAFHSPLLDPMLDEFEREASTIVHAAPRLPIVSNVTGAPATATTFNASYWRQHARHAVRFADGLRSLYDQGYRVFIECGPQPTLSGFGRQMFDGADVKWLSSMRGGQDDWQELGKALAEAYVSGVGIDWVSFDAPYERARVTLPTYPFERERHWVAIVPRRDTKRNPHEHPLVGAPLRSPAMTATVFQSRLDKHSLPYLYDHRVLDAPIMPAAGFIEMALTVARDRFGAGGQLSDVAIHRAMVLPEDGDIVLQSVVTPESDHAARIEIYSGSGMSDEWALHASARLERGAVSISAEPLDVVRARAARELPRDDFYDQMQARGLQFGPAFQGVQSLWHGEREAVGVARLDADAAGTGENWVVHPALLDACIQVLGAAVLSLGDDVFLPIGVDRVIFDGAPAESYWTHARLREAPANAGTLAADVTIYCDGRPAGRIEGLRLRRADAQSTAWSTTRINDWMYSVTWEAADLDAGGMAATTLAGVAETVAPLTAALADWPDVRQYDELLPRMEQVSVDFITGALIALGVQFTPGATLESAVASRLAVVPAQMRLFDRLLGILVEDGLLEATSVGWTVLKHVASSNAAARAGATAGGGLGSAELTLIARCGARLADVLTGACDPLSLLFPDGDQSLIEGMYQESVPARVFNELLREGVTAVLKTLPSGRRLRVLEVGGGTGSTTSYVVPQLPPDRTEYTFTDVSPLFAARAKDKFADYDFLTYRALDIERDPVQQGLEAHGFDLVIASNVLHATRDLRQALAHVRQMLAPNGLLVMLEVTMPERWLDITFGMTDGWWRFTDTDLRTSNPLIAPAVWRALLSEVGFGDISMLPGGDACGPTLGSHSVIMARNSAADTLRDSWAVVVSDRGSLATSVTRELARAGATCTEAASAADLKDVVAHHGITPGHVVYCRGAKDEAVSSAQAGADVMPAQADICGGLLEVVQALAGTSARLWIVTAGAQPVDGRSTALDPAQATLWGLGHVAALEHPELRPVRLDLDPRDPEAALCVVREMTAAGADDRVGYRYGRRFVARLGRQPLERPTPAGPYRLESSERGSLDRLALVACERRAPGPGEIEIAVEATALNFKDVMNALGMYPGDPGPLGGECAGRVAALGPGVHGFAVGDRVAAIAPGSFASHVVADRHLVVPVSPDVSVEDAVTVPIAFVTAHFALTHLAGMKPGQRVLIHAAAGGVGLAAVQLAQRTGAEVFATAGSDAKRALLRTMGVRHVMSSRTTEFADEIARLTGGAGVDIVLNSLSGDMLAPSFEVTAAGGTFLEIGKNGIWTPDAVHALGRNIAYHVIDWGVTARQDPPLIGAMLREIAADVDRAILKPLPHRTFALDEVVAAFRFMAQGRHIGKLVVRHPAPVPAHEGRMLVRPDATYLVTGGLAGLGLLTAQGLVARGARHLALLGRSAPSEAARHVIAAMEQSGVAVTVGAVDVADRAALAAFLGRVRATLPPLRGVVHSAGLLADGVLQQQTWDRFDTVFGPKVAGTSWLDELTRTDALDFFVIYSSVAGVFGSPGQANHAAANAFEDVLAVARQAAGRPATSISWGAWAEVGAAVRHKVVDRVGLQGMGTIAPEPGLDALDRIVASGLAHVVVAPIDWPRFSLPQSAGFLSNLARADRSRATAGARTARKAGILDLIAEAPPNRRPKLILDHVRAQAASVLGLGGADAIDDREPLHERGLDSLMAVELRNVLGKSLKQTLPATLLFDYPTVETLTGYLTVLVAPAPKVEEAAPAAPAGSPSTVTAIEEMSDEEVDRLFAARLGQGR